MARVSLKDIAQKIGVSSATVSLVLNKKDKKGRISKEVAEQVRQAAKELGYRPNMSARSLRTGKTKTLGLIVADISNPFFAKLARHVENIAAQKDYQVMFGSSDESSTKFQSLVGLFIEKNVDGIILTPPQNSEAAIMQLVNRKIPTVLVDRHLEGLPVSSVLIDNVGAALTLTNMLIKQGAEKIGFIAYNIELPNIKKRYEGYTKSLAMNGIELDPKLVHSVSFETMEADIENCIETLFSLRVDALVFATNRVGVQSLLTLQKYDKYRSIKYASIDYTDEYRIAQIPIICTEQPIDSLSDRALDILFRSIEDAEYSEVESIILQPKQLSFNSKTMVYQDLNFAHSS